MPNKDDRTIHRVLFSKKGLKIIYVDSQQDFTLESAEPPEAGFQNRLQDAIPFIVGMLGVQREWNNNVIVRGFKLTFSKATEMSVVFDCTKRYPGQEQFHFKTPKRKLHDLAVSNEDESAIVNGADTTLHTDVTKIINDICFSAEAFIDGARGEDGQTDMFAESDVEEEMDEYDEVEA